MQIDAGRVVEYKFAAKALEYGIIIGFPASEKLPYDFFCDNGKKTFKVQVKSTNTSRKGGYQVSVRTGRGSTARSYRPEEVDFVVLYIAPENTWYVVPLSKITSTTPTFYPGKPGKGKYSHYKERWDLLVNYGQ